MNKFTPNEPEDPTSTVDAIKALTPIQVHWLVNHFRGRAKKSRTISYWFLATLIPAFVLTYLAFVYAPDQTEKDVKGNKTNLLDDDLKAENNKLGTVDSLIAKIDTLGGNVDKMNLEFNIIQKLSGGLKNKENLEIVVYDPDFKYYVEVLTNKDLSSRSTFIPLMARQNKDLLKVLNDKELLREPTGSYNYRDIELKLRKVQGSKIAKVLEAQDQAKYYIQVLQTVLVVAESLKPKIDAKLQKIRSNKAFIKDTVETVKTYVNSIEQRRKLVKDRRRIQRRITKLKDIQDQIRFGVFDVPQSQFRRRDSTKSTNGNEKSDNAPSQGSYLLLVNITRYTSILVILFFVRILVGQSRYLLRLANYYDAQADVLNLLTTKNLNLNHHEQALANLIPKYEFGKSNELPNQKLGEIVDLIKNVSMGAKGGKI